jgi:hypothetical protein
MRGMRLTRILLAIYWNGACWMLFDGDNHLELAGLRLTWRKGWWFLGLLQRASLTFDGPGLQRTIVYFRPTLRHWFVDGWRLDDIDVGGMLTHLASDGEVRERVLKGLTARIGRQSATTDQIRC